jgi:2-C-methyl-D-erythritol 2,4-cyclodiphosphate synthase
MCRIGLGQDSHRFADSVKDSKKPLILGGVRISENGGLLGNSDTDVILHSLCNALSSAIGGDSLATWSDEMCFKKGIKDSKKYVEYVFKKVKQKKYRVVNVSICVEAKKPNIELETVQKIKETIASLLEIKKEQVGLTFTSGEGLTPFGQGKGIQSIAQVLLHG